MMEPGPGGGQFFSSFPQDPPELIEGEFAQGYHDPKLRHGSQLLLQEGLAGVPLFGGGFVFRGSTTYGCRNETVLQAQAILPIRGGALVGEAFPVQGPVEPVPGPVAGEHPAGSVGAVGCRGQSHHKEPGPGITEGGDWFSPVLVS